MLNRMKYRLVYKSILNRSMTYEEVRELARRATINNNSLSISGALVVSNNKVIQIIEGEEENVNALYYKHIHKDYRHQQIKVISAGNIEENCFSKFTLIYNDQDNPINMDKALLIKFKQNVLDHYPLVYYLVEYLLLNDDNEMYCFWGSMFNTDSSELRA